MKKIIALVMALLLIMIGCVACATPDNEEETPETTETPVLKMATNAYFQPYEYYDGDKIVGIDAEIAAAIAEKLGMELVIEDMAFDSIITAVK
jgi:polar amino acid transport system substrate-binding protein